MVPPRFPEQKSRLRQAPSKMPTAAESATYSYDMLVSLMELAEFHEQAELVLLLKAAAAEARSLSRQESR